LRREEDVMASRTPTLNPALEAAIRQEFAEHRAEVKRIFDAGPFGEVYRRIEENNRRLEGILHDLRAMNRETPSTRPRLTGDDDA
jgi:hypothetical protein